MFSNTSLNPAMFFLTPITSTITLYLPFYLNFSKFPHYKSPNFFRKSACNFGSNKSIFFKFYLSMMFLNYLLLNAGAIHFLPFSSILINFLKPNSKFFLFLPKHVLTLLLFNFNSTKSLPFNFTPIKSYVQIYLPRYLTLFHLLLTN